jgi:hypothetical protein
MLVHSCSILRFSCDDNPSICRHLVDSGAVASLYTIVSQAAAPTVRALGACVIASAVGPTADALALLLAVLHTAFAVSVVDSSLELCSRLAAQVRPSAHTATSPHLKQPHPLTSNAPLQNIPLHAHDSLVDIRALPVSGCAEWADAISAQSCLCQFLSNYTLEDGAAPAAVFTWLTSTGAAQAIFGLATSNVSHHMQVLPQALKGALDGARSSALHVRASAAMSYPAASARSCAPT